MNIIKRTILDVVDEKVGFVEGMEINEIGDGEFDVYLEDELVEKLSLKEIFETEDKDSFKEYISQMAFFKRLEKV